MHIYLLGSLTLVQILVRMRIDYSCTCLSVLRFVDLQTSLDGSVPPGEDSAVPPFPTTHASHPVSQHGTGGLVPVLSCVLSRAGDHTSRGSAACCTAHIMNSRRFTVILSHN